MNFEIDQPFKILSDSAQATECVTSTFSAAWGLIILPEEGHYRLMIKSTLNSYFQGKSIYKNQSALVSECRLVFAGIFENKYKKNMREDSFSVSGVHHSFSERHYSQMKPLKQESPKHIELIVMFKNKKIYIVQESKVYFILEQKNQKIAQALGIQG